MGTTNVTPIATKTVTMSVFDLTEFDSVKLEKEVTLPSVPPTIEDGLAACGNDTASLLETLWKGLCANALEAAKKDLAGFTVVDEDDSDSHEPYTGKYLDTDTPEGKEKSKQIGGMVINFAKMSGYAKSLPREKKRELKDAAREALRPLLIAQLGS